MRRDQCAQARAVNVFDVDHVQDNFLLSFGKHASMLFSFSRRELLSSPRTMRPSNVTTDTPSTSLFVIFIVTIISFLVQ
jgi:hypothetical protein